MQQSHQSQMVTSLEAASDVQVALFLCSVCQRQLSAYDYFMKLDKDVHRNTEGFEETLRICWNWAISAGRTVSPTILVDADFVHDDTQSSTGTALSAYATLWHLVQWIVDRNKSNIEPPICNAFDILDSHLYDHGHINYDAKRVEENEQHELVIAEVNRQKSQLGKVLDSDWRKANWSAFRLEVEGQMLLS